MRVIVHPEFFTRQECDWRITGAKILAVFGNKKVFAVEQEAINLIDDARRPTLRSTETVRAFGLLL